MAIAGAAGRRLRAVAAGLAAGEVALAPAAATTTADDDTTDPHPPLGSVEGIAPPLRSFTVAELLPPSSQPAPSGEAAEFPTAALPDEHPAVMQFRRLGYVAIEDALSGAALERVVGTFRRAQPHAEAVWQAMTQDHTSRAFLAGDSKETVQQYFDLPREDVVDPIEAWNSGAWGGFLVTQRAEDFDSYMLALNNALVMPLLQALVGPALHIMEAGARTVMPQPLGYVQENGGYTSWHRDYVRSLYYTIDYRLYTIYARLHRRTAALPRYATIMTT